MANHLIHFPVFLSFSAMIRVASDFEIRMKTDPGTSLLITTEPRTGWYAVWAGHHSIRKRINDVAKRTDYENYFARLGMQDSSQIWVSYGICRGNDI